MRFQINALLDSIAFLKIQRRRVFTIFPPAIYVRHFIIGVIILLLKLCRLDQHFAVVGGSVGVVATSSSIRSILHIEIAASLLLLDAPGRCNVNEHL